MATLAKRRLLDQADLSDHEKKNLQILDTIRKKGPIARAEISRLIGLNIVTVTSYVDQYIKKNVIKEVGIDVSTGGRKPTLVDLNPFVMYAIGIGLSLTKMIAVLTNFKGEVVYRIEKDRSLKPGEELVRLMVVLAEELIQKSNVDTAKVYGIGIGRTNKAMAGLCMWKKVCKSRALTQGPIRTRPLKCRKKFSPGWISIPWWSILNFRF